MKKNIKKLTLIVSAFIFLPQSTLAIQNPLGVNDFGELVGSITRFLFNIGLTLVPVIFLLGAFYLITAAGDENKIKKAKNIFQYTIVGLVILLISSGAVSFIFNLTSPGFDVEQTINNGFRIMFWGIVSIASLFFMLGAYYYMTAGQKPENIAKGKSVFVWAIVGLIMAFISLGIREFIVSVIV